MPKSILAFVEQWRGQVTDISFEVLALAGELSNELGAPVEAVLLGHNAGHLAGDLGKADRVLYGDHPALVEPAPEICAEILAGLVRERQPRCVLVPLTNVTMGIGTLLSARLQVAGINFVKDLAVAGGRIEARCVLYGGKIEATVVPCREPAVFGVWPGARPAEKGRAAGAPPVEQVAITPPDGVRVRFRKYIEPEAGDVDLTTQEILVAVGRGIQSKDNLELAEELAEALGGAVCGSRPVIDQGWLPLSRQIGKSGLTVKPKLYLAAGISGAPEHIEGMKDSGLIVAINSDPQAPIFNIAHYGIVADAMDVLPALAEAVRARKG